MANHLELNDDTTSVKNMEVQKLKLKRTVFCKANTSLIKGGWFNE